MKKFIYKFKEWRMKRKFGEAGYIIYCHYLNDPEATFENTYRGFQSGGIVLRMIVDSRNFVYTIMKNSVKVDARDHAGRNTGIESSGEFKYLFKFFSKQLEAKVAAGHAARAAKHNEDFINIIKAEPKNG